MAGMMVEISWLPAFLRAAAVLLLACAWAFPQTLQEEQLVSDGAGNLVGGSGSLFPASEVGGCGGQRHGLLGAPGEGGIETEWPALAWIAIMISMLLVSLAYMIGKGFGMREIEAWGKEELYQAIASAVILGSFIGLVVLMQQTTNAMAGDVLYAGSQLPSLAREGEAVAPIEMHWQYNGDCSLRWTTTGERKLASQTCGANDPTAACHFYLARGFLGSFFERLVLQADRVVRVYGTLAFLDSFQITLGGFMFEHFGLTVTTSPWAGNSIFYDTLDSPVFSTMVKSLMFLKFQEIALMYIERGVFPIFMVAGIVLRSLWFTRKLGGLLLALAIGFYTVWPLMYVLDWYTMEASQTSINTRALEEAVAQDRFTGMQEFADRENPDVDIGDITKTLFTKYREDRSVEYYGVIDIAARYAFIAFGAPVVNLFVLIGFVRGLSGFLGGDIEIAGLTKLI